MYSLPVNSNSRVTFLFVQDENQVWVPAQSGDIGADKWAVKITGYNKISGNKDFLNDVSIGGALRTTGTASFFGDFESLNTSLFNGAVTFGNVVSFNNQANFLSTAVFSNYTSYYSEASHYADVKLYGSDYSDFSAVPRIMGDDRWGSSKLIPTPLTNFSIDGGSYLNRTVRTSSNSPVSITILGDNISPWTDGQEVIFAQGGDGQITLVPNAGVTINSSETLKSARKFAYMALKRVSYNVFDLTGERELL